MPFPFSFPFPSSSSPTTAVHSGDTLLCPNCYSTNTPANTPPPNTESQSSPDRTSQDTAPICPSCLTRFQDLEPHERTRPETLTSFPALLETPTEGTNSSTLIEAEQSKTEGQQATGSKIRKFMGSISIPSLRGGDAAQYPDTIIATRTDLSSSASTSPSTPSTSTVSGME